jgi:hypothetical protein
MIRWVLKSNNFAWTIFDVNSKFLFSDFSILFFLFTQRKHVAMKFYTYLSWSELR